MDDEFKQARDEAAENLMKESAAPHVNEYIVYDVFEKGANWSYNWLKQRDEEAHSLYSEDVKKLKSDADKLERDLEIMMHENTNLRLQADKLAETLAEDIDEINCGNDPEILDYYFSRSQTALAEYKKSST